MTNKHCQALLEPVFPALGEQACYLAILIKVHVPLPRDFGDRGAAYIILGLKTAHCGRASSNKSRQVSSVEDSILWRLGFLK